MKMCPISSSTYKGLQAFARNSVGRRNEFVGSGREVDPALPQVFEHSFHRRYIVTLRLCSSTTTPRARSGGQQAAVLCALVALSANFGDGQHTWRSFLSSARPRSLSLSLSPKARHDLPRQITPTSINFFIDVCCRVQQRTPKGPHSPA